MKAGTGIIPRGVIQRITQRSEAASTYAMSIATALPRRGPLDRRRSGAALLHLIIETASGRQSKSEINGLGDNEFLHWQLGAVM